jgi:hypothetical protein
MRNEYTPQQIQEATEIYMAGGGIETVIRLFGGSRTGWKYRFARLGLPSRPEGVQSQRNEKQIAEVMRLRAEGLRFGEIGRRLNISRQRAHQIHARETAETTPADARRARREEILRQYQAGVPVKQIVRDCGLKNEQALRSLAYRWGVSRP